jgi:putative colanic acid biosynthesis acetyltransferase WcaF
MTGSHDVSSKHFNLVTSPIKIGAGVWVSTGSYILPGVSIGDYAVIAAGSVVVKNVEPWSIVGGNPAKFIKKRAIVE